MKISNDHPYLNFNNLIFCITQDIYPTEVLKNLVERRYLSYSDLKKQKPQVGEVTVIPYRNKKLIALTIKPYLDTKNLKIDMDKCLKTLGKIIDKLKLGQVKIIRDLDMMTQLQVYKFIESLNTVLEGKKIKAIFYNDNQKLPPVEERYKIMKQFHTNTVGAHYGMTKTYHNIVREFYWKNMRPEINHFIRCCPVCQKTKINRAKIHSAMIITDTPSRAFDKISLDLHGKLPDSNGYCWILTDIDLLTKYVVAIPLKSAKAEEIARALVDNVITQFDTPRALLTDLGANFQSKVMKAFAEMFQIEKMKTTAWHPASSGSIERYHASLVDYIKVFVGQKGNWSDYLRLACHAYNTAKHESTSFSPHELVYGYKARMPTSFEPRERIQTYGDYFVDLAENIIEAQTLAGLNLIQSKFKSKFYFDKKRNPAHFSPGVMVYIINHKKLNKHRKTSYLGSFEIVEVFPESNNVKLQIGNKIKTVHMDELRRAHQFMGKDNIVVNRVRLN